MLPYQQRVIEEAEELWTKIKKLQEFLEGNLSNHEIPQDELHRLTAQLNVMREYRVILLERIDNFYS